MTDMAKINAALGKNDLGQIGRGIADHLLSKTAGLATRRL